MQRKLIVAAGLLLVVLPLAVLAFGGLGGGNPSFAAGSGPRLNSMTLYAAPNGVGGARKSFSASADNMIYVQMQWLNLSSGLHDAYLTFHSPDGSIYQVPD